MPTGLRIVESMIAMRRGVTNVRVCACVLFCAKSIKLPNPGIVCVYEINIRGE